MKFGGIVMEHTKYRKHPRVYKKKEEPQDETVLTLGAGTAVGILAAVFIKGFFWGYLINRRFAR